MSSGALLPSGDDPTAGAECRVERRIFWRKPEGGWFGVGPWFWSEEGFQRELSSPNRADWTLVVVEHRNVWAFPSGSPVETACGPWVETRYADYPTPPWAAR